MPFNPNGMLFYCVSAVRTSPTRAVRVLSGKVAARVLLSTI
jgi:hypothetical protein